jgi:hypothetical protein
MRVLVSAVGLLLMLAMPRAAAEDFTGTWAGAFDITMNGETRPDVVHMVLKQETTTLTGTVGPNADQQWPIADGKVEGAKVTFKVQPNAGEGTIAFTLALVDGHLKGDAQASMNGASFSAAVDVTRKAN